MNQEGLARIRSVHPGLWTDEGFASCSPLARLLFMGLWSEADDRGVFEWKPVSLKMRLLPVDNTDMGGLLEELVLADAITTFDVEDRKCGAVRNFRKFQRPQSPNATFPTTPEIRNYVGLTKANGETGKAQAPPKVEIGAAQAPPSEEKPKRKPRSFPQKGEIAPQMEDGGCRMEGGEGKKEPSADADSSPDGDQPVPVEGGAKAETAGGDEVREAFDAYNATAERLRLPLAKTLADERRKKLRARLRALRRYTRFFPRQTPMCQIFDATCPISERK
jgi:hypothetical protein